MAKENNETPPVFWKENWDGEQAKGGIYFRSFDLNKFIRGVEEKDEVVGIQFDGNNIQLITKIKEDE
tara:strand:- start:148 stop:348 length:201 start_codon:yes stop_codon:yes gene_type:complete